MANLLKNLAEQANIKFEPHPQHHGVDTAVIITRDLHKFAELIVRECADIANKWQTSEHPGLLVKDVILYQFGVE